MSDHHWPNDHEPLLFDTIHTLRAMRRLKADPVPRELIRKVLAAGVCAPSGQNTQPWAFVVLDDPSTKQFFGTRYLGAMEKAFGERLRLSAHEHSSNARTIRAAYHLAQHMHEAPVILLVCGRRDWPFAVPTERRVGKAPPSYGSVYPCVQNILLACRGLGLGASLTTLHQMFADELCEHLEIPDEFGIVAAIPIGYPSGEFGPVSRQDPVNVTFFDRWGVKSN